MPEPININPSHTNIEGIQIGMDKTAVEKTGVTQKVTSTQDTVAPSAMSQVAKNEEVSECGSPTISQPNQQKLSGTSQQKAMQAISNNPWLAPSALVALQGVLLELYQLDSDTRAKEGLSSIDLRSKQYTRAKESGSLAKAIMMNQAQEQYIQASIAFTQASISSAQAVATVRNVGAAEKKVEASLEAKAEDVRTAQFGPPPPPPPPRQPGEVIAAGQPIGDTRPTLTKEELLKINPTDTPAVKEQKEAYIKLDANKHSDIQTEIRHSDSLVQYIGESAKQTATGVGNTLTGALKEKTAELEENQKVLDGFIQSLNKSEETISKSRDDAAGNANRLAELLKEMTKSMFQAHNIGRA